MGNYQSTKIVELGSCAFRQPNAKSHCRWLHGYRLYAKFWFGCNDLDDHNWVVDFGSLKGLKQKLKEQFDHTTCISADDPALPYFTDLASEDICDLRVMDGGVGIERFAEYCFSIANNTITSMTKGRCWVDRVEVWEHESNSAAYTRDITTNKPTETVNTTPVSCEEEAEDIATAVDNKQEAPEKKSLNPSNDPKQTKTIGRWVDPNVVNKPNSWMF